jgi:hypothetical protein
MLVMVKCTDSAWVLKPCDTLQPVGLEWLFFRGDLAQGTAQVDSYTHCDFLKATFEVELKAE